MARFKGPRKSYNAGGNEDDHETVPELPPPESEHEGVPPSPPATQHDITQVLSGRVTRRQARQRPGGTTFFQLGDDGRAQTTVALPGRPLTRNRRHAPVAVIIRNNQAVPRAVQAGTRRAKTPSPTVSSTVLATPYRKTPSPKSSRVKNEPLNAPDTPSTDPKTPSPKESRAKSTPPAKTTPHT